MSNPSVWFYVQFVCGQENATSLKCVATNITLLGKMLAQAAVEVVSLYVCMYGGILPKGWFVAGFGKFKNVTNLSSKS